MFPGALWHNSLAPRVGSPIPGQNSKHQSISRPSLLPISKSRRVSVGTSGTDGDKESRLQISAICAHRSCWHGTVCHGDTRRGDLSAGLALTLALPHRAVLT